jgi:uncharacterized membrane protein YfcA
MLYQTIAALLSGAAAGFVLALIGGGGSVLATPLLLYVVGVASPHVALGTGALAVSANAFANLLGHARKGHVHWRCAILFSVVGMAGAAAGSSIGLRVDGDLLLVLFALVMIVIAALMLRPRRVGLGDAPPITLRSCLRAGATALATGLAAGFFGIGGGFLIVPGLILSTGMATIHAVGTSLLAVGAFGLTTAITYALAGAVDWPVAGLFLLGGLAGGALGLGLATRLAGSKRALNLAFSAVVFVVALYVLFRSLR